MLVAFMNGEIDEVEALLSSGSPVEMMGALPGIERQLKLFLKAGARNAASDLKLINQMHQATVDLGATQCTGVVNATEKAPPAPTKRQTGRGGKA